MIYLIGGVEYERVGSRRGDCDGCHLLDAQGGVPCVLGEAPCSPTGVMHRAQPKQGKEGGEG